MKKSTRAVKAQSRKRSSSSSLKVGDLAELVYARTPFLSADAEVEIVGALKMRKTDRPDGSGVYREYGWQIQIGGDPGVYGVLPDQLRPIPPSDPLAVVRWTECPWQPSNAGRRTRPPKVVRS